MKKTKNDQNFAHLILLLYLRYAERRAKNRTSLGGLYQKILYFVDIQDFRRILKKSLIERVVFGCVLASL